MVADGSLLFAQLQLFLIILSQLLLQLRGALLLLGIELLLEASRESFGHYFGYRHLHSLELHILLIDQRLNLFRDQLTPFNIQLLLHHQLLLFERQFPFFGFPFFLHSKPICTCFGLIHNFNFDFVFVNDEFASWPSQVHIYLVN